MPWYSQAITQSIHHASSLARPTLTAAPFIAKKLMEVRHGTRHSCIHPVKNDSGLARKASCTCSAHGVHCGQSLLPVASRLPMTEGRRSTTYSGSVISPSAAWKDAATSLLTIDG